MTIDNNQTCTCHDFQNHGGRCKHIEAINIFRMPYPFTELIDPAPKPVVKQKKTYGQDWRSKVQDARLRHIFLLACFK